MSESTIRDLFRSLEQVISERLRGIEEIVLQKVRKAEVQQLPCRPAPCSETDARVSHMEAMNMRMFEEITQRLTAIEDSLEGEEDASVRAEILPKRPLEGIEVIPKRELVVPVPSPGPAPIRYEDQLLMNKEVRLAMMPAIEKEDRGEDAEEEAEMEIEEKEEAIEAVIHEIEAGPVEPDQEAEAAEAEEETEEVEAEEETEEAAAEAEEETEEVEAEEAEVQLEEFEYKGATYYRDPENNVYMADEDGELITEPFGVWNEAKQKILVKKPAA